VPADHPDVSALLAASGIVVAPETIEPVVTQRVSEDVDLEHFQVAAHLAASGIAEAPDAIAETVLGRMRPDTEPARRRRAAPTDGGRTRARGLAGWWCGWRRWLVVAPVASVCSFAGAWAEALPASPRTAVGKVEIAPMVSERHGMTDPATVLHGTPPHFSRLGVMFRDSRQLSLSGGVSASSTYAADVGLVTPAPTLIATLRGAGRIVGVADAYGHAYDAVVSVEVARSSTGPTGPWATQARAAPEIELGPGATSATLAARLLFVPPGDLRRVVLSRPDGFRVSLTLRVTEVGLEMRGADRPAP
jgi:hypothetical protein